MQIDTLDKRTLKTKKQLEETLLALLKTKNINKITVKEITSLSQVNRSTFYDHYTDIFDLLENVQNRVLSDIYNIYKNVTISNLKEKEFKQIYILFEYIKNNKETFKVLINGHGNILFIEKLKKIITEKFLNDFVGKCSGVTKEDFSLVSSFFVSGCIGVIENWVKNNAEMPIEKLTEIMKKLIYNCLSGIY